MDNYYGIDKDNIEKYLNELAKEIKKQFGRNEIVELILVGGASILINYDFRKSTMDIDAVKSTLSSINSCIHTVADKYELPDTWLNYDFKDTSSFSDKLRLHSKYHKTYGGVLKVYTVKDEYLIAMKLVAFRKIDIEDIENIVSNDYSYYSFERINKAVENLYSGWERISEKARLFAEHFFGSISHDESISDLENSNKPSITDT